MSKSQHIDLKKTIFIILKKWWLLVLLVLIFAFGARFIRLNYVDNVYKAQTTLFIGKEAGTLGNIGLSFADIQTYNQLIVDYKEIANTRLVITATMNNLNINMDPMDFKKSMSVDIIENSRLFTVSFSSTDSVLAAAAANELAKQLTIAVSEIVNVENIRIVDTALVPTSPIPPSVNVITFFAGMIGLILGLFIVYLIEVFDDTFSNQDSVENELGFTVIGIIPKFRAKVKNGLKKVLVTISEPYSYLSESYRICRTNINYINVDNNYKVLMLTSSASSEGKTTTSCNLAITIAQADKKVLLVDGDLRKSSIHKLFNIHMRPGLTDVIYNNCSLSDAIQHIENVPCLDILTAGKTTPKPAEMLGSDSFKKFVAEVRNLYDMIIIDVPPVLTVSDAVIISQLADGILFVVAMKETNREIAEDSKKALEKVGANIMGAILTKIKPHNRNYYYNSDNQK